MTDNQKTTGFFNSLGRLLGYLDQLGISILGCLLIIGGAFGAIFVFIEEESSRNPSMIGSGLAMAGCLISGALLQSGKRSDK